MDLRRRFSRFGRGRNGNLEFGTSQTTATLITATNSACTIYIQRIIITIITSAGQHITFQDTNSSPVIICAIPDSAPANSRWDFDFGAKGVPLTIGKNLQAVFSAAGLAGNITWEGYQVPLMLA